MVLAYHVIISAYGFWLPNDPRGSWSDFVGAKAQLKYPPVKFTGRQAVSIAKGFEQACAESGYRVHAMAILPDHCHLLVGRLERSIRQVVGHLKARATQQLIRDNLHPFQDIVLDDGSRPTCWAGKSWDVFVDSEDYVRAAIRYIRNNPLKEGKSEKKWNLVSRYPFRTN